MISSYSCCRDIARGCIFRELFPKALGKRVHSSERDVNDLDTVAERSPYIDLLNWHNYRQRLALVESTEVSTFSVFSQGLSKLSGRDYEKSCPKFPTLVAALSQVFEAFQTPCLSRVLYVFCH